MDRAVSEDNIVTLIRTVYKYQIQQTFSNSTFFLLDDKGMLELIKTTDYGRSFHTIATRVYSFVLGGRFVFASIMTGTVCVCICPSVHLFATISLYFSSHMPANNIIQLLVEG